MCRSKKAKNHQTSYIDVLFVKLLIVGILYQWNFILLSKYEFFIMLANATQIKRLNRCTELKMIQDREGGIEILETV